MKVLITGITGNLGYEVALNLKSRGITLIPIIRPGKNADFNTTKILFKEVIENDLLKNVPIISSSADCIVHCAGNIHFRNSDNSNEKMTTKLVGLAKDLQIPFYLVSTAYIYRPPDMRESFNNAYELDKHRSEQVLKKSGISYGIFRPSVLVGNSKSGIIQNFSGYYSIVKAFYKALMSSKQNGKKLRFPNLQGTSNLVPVDQAAFYIGNEIQNLKMSTVYITNPKPPKASWVLNETVNFLNLSDTLNLVECAFEDFETLHLTFEEKSLYEFIKHFYPYWSISYDFPSSACQENLITHTYLYKTLTFLNDSNYFKNE